MAMKIFGIRHETISTATEFEPGPNKEYYLLGYNAV
jgi:hypothetical protein